MKTRYTMERLPLLSGRKNGRFLYPWPKMRYGDYVIVPARLAKSASVAAYNYGRRYGLYFRCANFGTQGRMRITRLALNPNGGKRT